jgi:Ca-activated chloride channel family protein
MRHRLMKDARPTSSSFRKLGLLWNCRSVSLSRQPALSALLIALAVFPAKASQIGVAETPPPQTQEQAPDSRGRIRSTVELVVVPVTVKDSKGNLIADIGKDEFRVFEDGVEQKISLFSTDAFPLSAVVLLDDDLKPKAADQLRKSLIAIAGAFSESDEVSLAGFASFFSPVMEFTKDNDRLMAELKRLVSGDEAFPDPESTAPRPTAGGQPIPGAATTAQQVAPDKSTKHLDDALHAAAQTLRERDRQRRKVVILVSDGVDAKNNTYNYDQTLAMLLSSDVSVYAIGTDAALLRRGASPLSRYARATGGDTYFVNSVSALSRAYAQVAEEARHQYTLGYVPTGTDRTQNYHSIEVRVKRQGLDVLSRDGYYLVRLP